MKKILLGLAMAGMIAANIHTTTAVTWENVTITDVQNRDEYSVLHDKTGNNWLVADELEANSKYLIIFDDQGTKQVEDDEIVYYVKIA